VRNLEFVALPVRLGKLALDVDWMGETKCVQKSCESVIWSSLKESGR